MPSLAPDAVTGACATRPGPKAARPAAQRHVRLLAPGDLPDGGVPDLAGVRAQADIVETWKLSTDPQFIEKVRDIVGLYLDPPDSAMVLCVDEKSQMQALDRTAPVLPMMPGDAGAADP